MLDVRRREFITLLGGAAAWPLTARAQSPRKRPLIAVLNGASPTTGLANRNAFLQGLQDLGHAEGKDIDIVHRFADGDASRQPALAKELIALEPDVIFTANEAASVATKKLTSTIPIVCPNLADPVGFGLAASYSRPEGNVTGILITLDGLTSKQLEFLLELIPRAAVVAMLINPAHPNHPRMFREAEAASRSLSVKLVNAEIRVPENLETHFRGVKA
jgi:putative tryptophan/tyrosine transport system substrate-binding protein